MSRIGSIDAGRATAHLMDLLAIEGGSGSEGAVAAEVTRKLRRAGCRANWIFHDGAHRKIPDRAGRYEIGNLIVKVPGTRRGPRLMFSGHMDTVPLCRGVVPLRRGNRIVSRGPTALGGDNRTAVAALVTMVETLLESKASRPPITVLFTIGEESGLWGARMVRVVDLGRPRMGFNIDGGDPARLAIGALGADRWEAHVRGRSAHAGAHPERGVSAALIAARAIRDVADRGYFGKVVKGPRRGSSNVGWIRGGEATNQVTAMVRVRGESRSHDPRFARRISDTWERAFQRAARSVKNHEGKCGSVRFERHTDYAPFRLNHREPVVRRAIAASESLRLKSTLISVDGGLDANWLNAKGVPTVTFGAGQHSPHTESEYVDLREFVAGCRMAVWLATHDVAGS